MSTAALFLLALGLAMDAFAVSVTDGMLVRVHPLRNALLTGAAFGLAQGVMPLIGFLAGHTLSDAIRQLDHWIAFGLLCFIGGRMIWEALREPPSGVRKDGNGTAFSAKLLFLQALATSIDALAVGVTLPLLAVPPLQVAGMIGAVTFLCCFAGVLIGHFLGVGFRKKAEILGGVILILIGVHILFEHIGMRCS